MKKRDNTKMHKKQRQADKLRLFIENKNFKGESWSILKE